MNMRVSAEADVVGKIEALAQGTLGRCDPAGLRVDRRGCFGALRIDVGSSGWRSKAAGVASGLCGSRLGS